MTRIFIPQIFIGPSDTVGAGDTAVKRERGPPSQGFQLF